MMITPMGIETAIVESSAENQRPLQVITLPIASTGNDQDNWVAHVPDVTVFRSLPPFGWRVRMDPRTEHGILGTTCQCHLCRYRRAANIIGRLVAGQVMTTTVILNRRIQDMMDFRGLLRFHVNLSILTTGKNPGRLSTTS
eukprot:TRINITY_DN109041_c0_g1_i1.p1 TRINITY_DN109041_c0_g1~~TRINITY_DN109041_c0_g1_i1.p1  ORF type:complete len:141 (+),score=4.35 TRINITY_DN109041_c0_g1_i1:295-717(+)